MCLVTRLLCLVGWHDPTEITSFWAGRLTYYRVQCRHCGSDA